MKIIVPKSFTDATITSTTAINADADYVAITTYANGDKVTHQGYIYLSLQNANTGHTPGITASAAWWSLVTASNKNAMFDAEVATQTTASNTLTVTLPASYVDSLACTNIVGAEVHVVMTKDATVVFDRTLDLSDTGMITDWSLYYFSEHEFKTDFAITDMPPLPDVVITFTITKPTSTVAVGNFAVGRVFDVGLEDYGLQREGIDYTIATNDKFGNLTLDKQAYARKFSTTARLPNSRYDFVSKRLDAIASVPVVCIGGNDLFSSLIVFGLVSYTLVIPYFDESHVNIEVKGLV